MGLLSSIAAALSEGVGNGMVANAKWGIEEEAQRKKEAEYNDRLKQQLQRYDDDRDLRKQQFSDSIDESQRQRVFEAEQRRLDREAQLSASRMRSSGDGNNANELRGLRFVDGKITDFDTSIGNLLKTRDAEMDPEKQTVIDGQIEVLRSQRKAFVTNPATINILNSSGDLGKAYAASLFSDTQPAEQNNTKNSTIPESLLVPPPSRPDANQSNWSGGDPSLQPQPKKTPTVQNNYGIWDRVSSDVSSLGSGLLNKMNNAYKTPLDR